MPDVVKLRTETKQHGRDLMLRVHPRYLEIGEERGEYLTVPYDALYEFACKLRAAEERRAKTA